MLNRKIIHIDMDCFYAAIEIRDNPELINKPVAVGGNSERSVLCTCNYVARRYGVHSAMSSRIAKSKCKDLIILPVNMSKYKKAAKIIQSIFFEFTNLVEPLSLDEAYLDVTSNQNHNNSASLIAQDIRERIWDEVNLTASAGIAPNKFLAKIASGWNKPNGQFVIPPNMINSFVANLPVEKIFGVGKVTLAKLHKMNIKKCIDVQEFSL
ncbi:MAG: dinB, partial [Burkholderiales bacterium]|nr:dinB [Burkholderiales bacterium]